MLMNFVAKSVQRVRRERVEGRPFVVDIRQLKKMGLLVPGQRTDGKLNGDNVTCDLRFPDLVIFIYQSGPFMQLIKLISRRVGRGNRWFFEEGTTGIVCEKMYLTGNGFVSRQTAGFRYESQLQNAMQRKLTRARKICSAIVGTVEKGPARGQSKAAKKQELKMLTKELRKFASTLRDSI
jgi:hypothetical protein